MANIQLSNSQENITSCSSNYGEQRCSWCSDSSESKEHLIDQEIVYENHLNLT